VGRSRRKYTILFGLTLAVIALDQLTKRAVLARFRLGESWAMLDGWFDLTYVRNSGAAFGLLAHADPTFRIPFFVIVPLVALSAIGYVFQRIPDGDLKLSTSLSLVVGGAVGNLIDRLLWGYVVDFLDFHWNYQYHFPAFNVADAAICVGVAILILDLATKDSTRAPGAPQPEPAKDNPVNASAPR
jgi:signal peptidase II